MALAQEKDNLGPGIATTVPFASYGDASSHELSPLLSSLAAMGGKSITTTPGTHPHVLPTAPPPPAPHT